MKQPLISIYTPTYNRNNLLLNRALKSVLLQTYENWEYIIVSDGKNPKLRKILEVAFDDPRIKYYESERKEEEHSYDTEIQWLLGGTHPANFALDKVRGSYIARLDDDDLWAKDHLEKSLNFLTKNNLDFITSQFIILKENKGIFVDCTKHKISNNVEKIGCHSSYFYKAELKDHKYDPKCYKKSWNRVNDADFLERLFRKNIKYGFKKDATVFLKPRNDEKEVGLQAVLEKKRGIKK